MYNYSDKDKGLQSINAESVHCPLQQFPNMYKNCPGIYEISNSGLLLQSSCTHIYNINSIFSMELTFRESYEEKKEPACLSNWF